MGPDPASTLVDCRPGGSAGVVLGPHGCEEEGGVRARAGGVGLGVCEEGGEGIWWGRVGGAPPLEEILVELD